MKTDGKSVKELKELLDAAEGEELKEFSSAASEDERESVRKLAASAEKRYASFLKEKERILKLRETEDGYRERGYAFIAGVDEAGRGPLCGPVVSCTLILPPDHCLFGVNDSKKLSEKKREELYERITADALACEVGIADNFVIDELNILNATKKTITDSLERIRIRPDIVLLDALKVDTDIPQEGFVKGDARIYSIAAASIVAKVTRDRMMYEYDRMYPEYGFASNKGYGTAEHLEAIRRYGLTPIHRLSFVRNFADMLPEKSKYTR